MGGMVDGEWLRLRIDQLVRQIPPVYFQSKRWFGSKTRTITGYRVVDFGLLETEPDMFGLLLLEILYEGAESELYQVPLALKPESEVPASIREHPVGAAFVVPTPSGDIWAYDAFAEDRFCALLHEGMYDDREVQLTRGKVVFRRVPGLLDSRDVHTVRRVSTEQSNTSVIFNDALILKTFRKLSVGLNPEVEVPYFLTTHTGFDYVPKVAGFIDYRHAGTQQISLGVLQDFVANQGDGYTNTLIRVRDYFGKVLHFVEERPDYTAYERTQQALRCSRSMQDSAHRLGQITGLLHNALASNSELPAFRPEPVTGQDIERWEISIARLIKHVIQAAWAKMADLPPGEQELLRLVVTNEPAYLHMIAGLNVLEREACHKTRYHGDYHLGQVLKTGNDFTILDFEGEPARSLAERRAKHCPLKDVAGLLRSFNYAVNAILFEVWKERLSDSNQKAELEGWALAWENLVRTAFLGGYREATGVPAGPRVIPADDMSFLQVVRIFEVEKAFYELSYEFNNRPTWIPIPVNGLLRLLQNESSAIQAG